MGQYTGAGTIFGATGGVMEAAIRTAYAILSGKELGKLEVEAVRGMQGIKEASLDIPLKDSSTTLSVNVAVAHGLGNAKKLLEDVQAGKKSYHFIEIMACPGGCVGGGGQPYGSSIADRARRGESLYKEDKDCEEHKPLPLPSPWLHQNRNHYPKYLSPKGHTRVPAGSLSSAC